MPWVKQGWPTFKKAVSPVVIALTKFIHCKFYRNVKTG
jgi:hypothetical protein